MIMFGWKLIAHSSDNRLQRTKHDVFSQDNTGIWDSDEADDSLQNQLEKLDSLKYYDCENSCKFDISIS